MSTGKGRAQQVVDAARAVREAQANVQLDDNFYQAVRSPVVRTWGAIAGDAAQLGVRSQADAMELVLDANRMAMFGGKEEGPVADKLVGEACTKFGYAKVSLFLRRRIRLDV